MELGPHPWRGSDGGRSRAPPNSDARFLSRKKMHRVGTPLFSRLPRLQGCLWGRAAQAFLVLERFQFLPRITQKRGRMRSKHRGSSERGFSVAGEDPLPVGGPRDLHPFGPASRDRPGPGGGEEGGEGGADVARGSESGSRQRLRNAGLGRAFYSRPVRLSLSISFTARSYGSEQVQSGHKYI